MTARPRTSSAGSSSRLVQMRNQSKEFVTDFSWVFNSHARLKHSKWPVTKIINNNKGGHSEATRAFPPPPQKKKITLEQTK